VTCSTCGGYPSTAAATSELHVGLQLEERFTELLNYVVLYTIMHAVEQFLEQFDKSRVEFCFTGLISP